MPPHISLIPLIYVLVSIPYTIFGLHAWRHRPAVAIVPFAWLMVGMAVWSLAYGLEIMFTTVLAKLFMVDIEYLGIVSVPVCLLIFALEYTGRRHLVKSHKIYYLLWVIPLLILIATWTNEFHGLMWDSISVKQTLGLNLLSVQQGPLYWLNVGYAYILVLLSTLLLIIEFVQRPGIYRIQVSLAIIGLLFPWLGSVIYEAGLSPIRELDLTPIFFIPTSLAFGWAIMRYRLLEVLPLEHAAVLQNMRDGVIVVDARQRLLYLNPIAEALFGLSGSGIIGQPLHRVSHTAAEMLSPHLVGKEAQFELSLHEGANASVYDVTVSPIPSLYEVLHQQHSNHAIIFHEITLRKEAESLLGRREAIMKAIGFAAEQFLKESLWEHTIPAVLEKIGQATDVSRVYAAMNYTDADGTLFSSLCYEWAAAGIPRRINDPNMQHIPLRTAGFGRWEECLGSGGSIHGLLKDFPQGEQDFLGRQQVISMAVAPIFAEKQWWGFVGFDECRYEREWTVTELEALHTAASIFGSAETRTRAEQRLLRRQRTLNLLQNIVLASLQSSDIGSMAEKIVEQLGKLINADGCSLSLWQDANKQTIPLAAYGPYKETFPTLHPQPGEKTLTAAVMKIGKTLVVEDVANSPHISTRIGDVIKPYSAMALPLIAGYQRMGAVVLTFDRPHHFQPEEILISEQACNLIALALEKFQAVELARRRANESETLRKAAFAVTETLHTDEAVARILEQLAQVIPYDSASVQILNESELEIVGGRGWEDESEVVGMRFPIPSDNPNTLVIQTGVPLILSEAEKKYPAFNNPPHSHIRSWMGVPLIVHSRIIGLLTVDSARPNHFSQENLELVKTFADQVAIALENARRYMEKQMQAITDALTGIYNRRGLLEVGQFEFARARRINRPFSAIILDIDHFKEVNDKHGHAAGDQALRTLSDRCQDGSRAVDLVGRYGGEEFVLLMPETNLEAARLVAERLRLSITNEPFITDAGPIRMTVSIGVAEMNDSDNLPSLINRADVALYKAKNRGRNLVTTAK